MLLAALVMGGLGAIARADVITPAGLNPGDQFRIVFLSDTSTPATSANVATYDAIVAADAAAAGLGSYHGSPVTWQAIVSTPTVDAISRLPADNVPIYLPHVPTTPANAGSILLMGPPGQVSPSGADLWNVLGSSSNPLYNPLGGTILLEHQIDMTASGVEGQIDPNVFTVWTGSQGDGTAGIPLGSGSSLTFKGSFINTSDDWITNFLGSPTVARQLYGFSNVLTVPFPAPAGPPAVPEPGTLTLVLVGLGGLMGARRWRRGR